MLKQHNETLHTELNAKARDREEREKSISQMGVSPAHADSSHTDEEQEDEQEKETPHPLDTGIVNLLSCSTIGQVFSDVFSSGAVTPINEELADAAPDQLVSHKLQSVFGVEYEEEKSSVRHLRHNRERKRWTTKLRGPVEHHLPNPQAQCSHSDKPYQQNRLKNRYPRRS